MILLKTQQEFVALDLGMQILQRHQLQAELTAAQGRVIDLEAEVKSLKEASKADIHYETVTQSKNT